MEPYYKDDLVTLYHGDCLEVTEWLDADVLVTDPPYGISLSAGQMFNTAAGRLEHRRKNVVKNDHDPSVRDKALLLWGQRPAIVFGSWRIQRPESVRQRLIWHKKKSSPGISNAPWFAADEEIYVIGDGFRGKPAQNVYQTNECRQGNNGVVHRIGHPTPKPIGLMEQLIEKCPPGVIADPFAGSGSTLIAARNLGRRAIGVELEERYCELIAKRLSQQAFDLEGIA
jgi:DNA modification methylase